MADLNNKEKAQRLQDMYEYYTTIEDKLSFLVENANHYTAVEGLGDKVSQEEADAHEKNLEKFIRDYVVEGNEETRIQVYESLGKLITKNNREMYQESQRLLKDIPETVQNREKAAYWLARNASQSGARLSVLNDLSQKISSDFLDVPSLGKKLAEELGLDENTTMEEYASLIGYTEPEQIKGYLEDYEAEPGTKALAHLQMQGKELTEIQGNLIKGQTLRWMRQGEAEYLRGDISPEELQGIREVNRRNGEELSVRGIREWIRSEGEGLVQKKQEALFKEMLSTYEKNYTKPYERMLIRKDAERFRMRTMDQEKSAFTSAQTASMENMDRKLLEAAGIKDSRPHSNDCIFDLFVMAKHGVAFKDIPKFERGKLEGHDKAAYLKEFEQFVKDHPISKKENGKITYLPENATAWGELYRDADKVISQYRMPDVDLGNPENWEGIKDEMVLLTKIGTDFVQVIQGQMEKFRKPELNEGYLKGFGSEEAQQHFWANVVTLQNCKGYLEEMGTTKDERYVYSGGVMAAELRWYASKNQDAYRGKTLLEFDQRLPEFAAVNALLASPFGAKGLGGLAPGDRQAVEAFLEKGTPLPERIEQQMQADFDFLKNSYYPDMISGEVKGELDVNLSQKALEEIKQRFRTEKGGSLLLAEMTPEQRKAAELTFHQIFTPGYSLYAVTVNMTHAGKNIYDMIKVNGKALAEHCEERYNEDPIFGEEREFAELSDEEKHSYMRMEAARALASDTEQVTCHTIVRNDKGELVVDGEGAAIGSFDPKARELPEPADLTDEQLKASYFNPLANIHSIITSLPTDEAVQKELNSPTYKELNIFEEDTAASKLYVPEDKTEPSILTVVFQNYGIDRKIYQVANPKYLERFRDALRQNADRCDQINEDRLNSNEEMRLYANDLMRRIDLVAESLNRTKAEKEYYEKDEGEAVRQEQVRTAEALVAAEKKRNELADRTQKLEEEIKKLPDGETPLVFNPFSAGGNKRQKEMELSSAREALEKAEKELADARENVQRAEERKRNYEQHLGKLEYKLNCFQERHKKIEQDASPEDYEQIREKTRKALKAMGPNRLRRAAEGFSTDYVSMKTPFGYGGQAFGPVMDLGYEKSITAKVAECSGNDFPVYDAIIAEDAVEEALTDYWKEKEKTPMDPHREELYRRRLYDQVSQLDSYLQTMYDTLEDPEKNQQLWNMQITDKLNEPFHLHQENVRGTIIVKASAEAYKAGLEQGWHIDDLGTLASFNLLRKGAHSEAEHPTVLHLKEYQELKEPVYRGVAHKRWLEQMDSLWEKLQTTPVRSAQQRKELLDEIQEQVRQGYTKGYLNKKNTEGFQMTYRDCRKRDRLIEQGLEPAYVETKGLTISDKGKERLQEIREFKEQELDSNNAPGLEEEPDPLTREELNTGFMGVKTKNTAPEPDWEYERAAEKFNSERSSVFMGRESELHERLRTAAERMQEIRSRIGYPMDSKLLPKYLNALDEVAYTSRQYQERRADAKTGAGKERLEGAGEFEKMAKEELLRVKKAMNKELKTDQSLNRLRTKVAEAEASAAEQKLGRLMDQGRPLTDKEKEKVSGYAATIMMSAIATSSVEIRRNGFQNMGANIVKQSITTSKEFKNVMQEYFKKPKLTAKELVGELKNGGAIKKMTGLRKNLEVDEKSVQQLADKVKNGPKKDTLVIGGM